VRIQHKFPGTIINSVATDQHLVVLTASDKSYNYSILRFDLSQISSPVEGILPPQYNDIHIELKFQSKCSINRIFPHPIGKFTIISTQEGNYVVDTEWKKLVTIKFKVRIPFYIFSM
jgi:hypothetical protein